MLVRLRRVGACHRVLPENVALGGCRPLSSAETARGEPVVIAVKGNRVVVRNTVGKATGAGSLSLDKAYAYDKVRRSPGCVAHARRQRPARAAGPGCPARSASRPFAAPGAHLLSGKPSGAQGPSFAAVCGPSTPHHLAFPPAARPSLRAQAYNQFAKQSEVFEECAMPVIEEVLLGYSATIFAYGQTGTGKTFTMEGEMSRGPAAGIIPRSVVQIFDRLEARSRSEDEFEFSVRLSFLEVYNEQLFDLFGTSADDLPDDASSAAYNPRLAASRKPLRASERLKLVEDSRKGLVKVQNLEEIVVHSADEAFERVSGALAKRQVAETKCNAFSSRSHGIFTLQIHSKEKTVEGEDLIRVGKLHLVDLAGSENVGRSGAKDKRLREAGNINQSLLTLGRVITALVEQRGHVPYRDSKLTRLLRDSLGGRTKTTIIATLSPSACSIEETLSTLDYALRARSIKNRPEANQRMTKRQLLRDFSTEIDHLRGMLQAARDKDGVFLPHAAYQELTAARASAEMQLEELKELRAVHEEEAARLGEELAELSAQVEELTARAEAAEESLREAEETIAEREGTIAEREGTIAEREGTIEDKQALVLAEGAAREELEAQARGVMTDAVVAAATDADGLHAKVARLGAEARRARSGVHGAQASLREGLDSLLSSTNAWAESHAADARSAAESMRAQARAAEGAARAAAEGMEAAKAAARAATADVQSRIRAWREASEGRWGSAAAEAAGPGADAVRAAAAEGASAVEAALGRAQEAAARQEEASRAWAERAAAAADASARAWEAFANTHTAAVSRCRDRAVSAIEAAAGELAAEAGRAAAYDEARAAAEEAAEARVRDGVAELLREAFTGVRSARGEAVAATRAACGTAAEAAASAVTAVRGDAKGLAEAASRAARTGAATARDEKAAAEASLASSLEAGRAVAAVVAEEVPAAVAGASAAVCAAAEASAEAVAAASRAAAEADTAASRAAAGAAERAAAVVASAVDESAAASLRRGKADALLLLAAASAADDRAAGTAAHASAVTAFGDEASAAVCALGRAVAQRPTTGTTPSKREYVVPRHLAAASPHDRVVARVHARRAAGAAVTPSVSRSAESAARAAEVTPVRVPSALAPGFRSDSPVDSPVASPAADQARAPRRPAATAAAGAADAASPPAAPSRLPSPAAASDASARRQSAASDAPSLGRQSTASSTGGASTAGSLNRLIHKVPSSANLAVPAAVAPGTGAKAPRPSAAAPAPADDDASVDTDDAKSEASSSRRPSRRGRSLAASRGAPAGRDRSSSRASARSNVGRATSNRTGRARAASGIPAPSAKRTSRRATRSGAALGDAAAAHNEP